MGVGLAVKLQDTQWRGAFSRMKQFPGTRMRQMLGAIGAYGENSTRLRFRTQTSPAGVPWKPSQRALKTGGQTLVKSGRLRASQSHDVLSGNSGVEWGTNLVYGPAMQFGATIHREPREQSIFRRMSRGGVLSTRFVKRKHANVEQRVHVPAHDIVIPARPFIGLSPQDRVEIVTIAERAEAAAALGTSPGGAP